MPAYVPSKDRLPSAEYLQLLRQLRSSGERVSTKQGQDALTLMGQMMRFDARQGAPVINERSIKGFVPKAIGELCAFINGARTLEEFADFGCDWWGPWASTEKCQSRGLNPGDLGPGSYGHAFRNFNTVDVPTGNDLASRCRRFMLRRLGVDTDGFDQLPHLIKKLRDLPNDRTAFLSPWVPVFNHREQGVKSRNTIAPCHGWVHARVLNGKLHLTHVQRSGDVPIGVPSNMVQYFALGLMLEHLTGYELVEYVHFIIDAHIYVNQLEPVDVMLHRQARPLPTLRLTAAGRQITDIHDFRGEHFELGPEYNPHPAIRSIPVLT